MSRWEKLQLDIVTGSVPVLALSNLVQHGFGWGF